LGTRDPRVDAYIAKSASFAQPILSHLRDVVHAACPEAEETMKWSMPFFVYRGSPLCNMAAHKAHASFGFWLGAQVLGDAAAQQAMGQFGRLTRVKDLPGKTLLTRYIRKAMALTDAGVTLTRSSAVASAPVTVPPALARALAAAPEVQARFDALSPSHRREYCEWIAGARKDETVKRRVATAVELIAEGKSQNWKYEVQ
jgi:uncharacterized protein YdeI (YjbR/CyaY-like superfamily)